MTTQLRDLCEAAISELAQSGYFDARGVHSIWSAFLREPDSPMWARARQLCVLAHHLR